MKPVFSHGVPTRRRSGTATPALPLSPPLKHEGWVHGARFNADGSRILTWSRDKTVRLWDSRTGYPITPALKHGEAVDGAVFNADESHILTWGKDGVARLWDLNVKDRLPREHAVLQLEVQTGTRLDDVGELKALSREEWQERKRQYQDILARP